jgi:hypothetical protein
MTRMGVAFAARDTGRSEFPFYFCTATCFGWSLAIDV